jgi:hypothetical protein
MGSLPVALPDPAFCDDGGCSSCAQRVARSAGWYDNRAWRSCCPRCIPFSGCVRCRIQRRASKRNRLSRRKMPLRACPDLQKAGAPLVWNGCWDREDDRVARELSKQHACSSSGGYRLTPCGSIPWQRAHIGQRNRARKERKQKRCRKNALP